MGETIKKKKKKKRIQTQKQTDWLIVSTGKRCIKGSSILYFAAESSISKFLQDHTSGFACFSPFTKNHLQFTSQLNILQTMLLCFINLITQWHGPSMTTDIFAEREPCPDSELSPSYKENSLVRGVKKYTHTHVSLFPHQLPLCDHMTYNTVFVCRTVFFFPVCCLKEHGSVCKTQCNILTRTMHLVSGLF